jgi:hypothetical protein
LSKQKKKFKRRISKKKQATHSTLPKIKIDRPEINTREAIIVVPQFEKKSYEGEAQGTPKGRPGIYRISYILSVPGEDLFHSHLDINKLISSGHSLLRFPKGFTMLRVGLYDQTSTVPINLVANKNGLLSNVEMSVHAKNFLDAEKFCYDVVQPLLSSLSFQYDVALDVGGYEVTEESTQVRKFVFGLIGKEKIMDPALLTIGVSKSEFRMVFSAYREGLNATNVFYKLLSYYKVIEGVRGIRKMRRRKYSDEGTDWREPRERLPEIITAIPSNSPWINEYFLPYLGKKFSSVLDEFRGIFRNALAHLDPEQDVLLGDRFEDVIKCEKAIPVLKYIAREMFLEELRCDPDYAPHIQ